MDYKNNIKTINLEQLKESLSLFRKQFAEVITIDRERAKNILMFEDKILRLFSQFGFTRSFGSVDQWYRQNINLGTGEFSFVFDLPMLQKAALHFPVEQIALSEFSCAPRSTKTIFYGRVDFEKEPPEKSNTDGFYTETELPIMLAPFPIGDSYLHYTVDGNHRVTAKLDEGVLIVNAHKLDADATYQAIPIPFQKVLYNYIWYLKHL
ncbi:MAG: hypothetical protein ACK5LX_11660 [Oscillospiraceae bacterium]